MKELIGVRAQSTSTAAVLSAPHRYFNFNVYIEIYIKIAPTCFGLATIIRELTICASLKLQLLKHVVMETVRSCGCIFIQSVMENMFSISNCNVTEVK
jgi:hypothetical protein